MDAARYARLYRNKLLGDVLPFWLNRSPDYEYGGYFTCLDRTGEVYDSDKFMWLQGREVWVLSKMYRLVRQEDKYLDVARLGQNSSATTASMKTGISISPWSETEKPMPTPASSAIVSARWA